MTRIGSGQRIFTNFVRGSITVRLTSCLTVFNQASKSVDNSTKFDADKMLVNHRYLE